MKAAHARSRAHVGQLWWPAGIGFSQIGQTTSAGGTTGRFSTNARMSSWNCSVRRRTAASRHKVWRQQASTPLASRNSQGADSAHGRGVPTPCRGETPSCRQLESPAALASNCRLVSTTRPWAKRRRRVRSSSRLAMTASPAASMATTSPRHCSGRTVVAVAEGGRPAAVIGSSPPVATPLEPRGIWGRRGFCPISPAMQHICRQLAWRLPTRDRAALPRTMASASLETRAPAGLPAGRLTLIFDTGLDLVAGTGNKTRRHRTAGRRLHETQRHPVSQYSCPFVVLTSGPTGRCWKRGWISANWKSARPTPCPALSSASARGCRALAEHRCSYGEPGGFVRRLQEGTWPAHILEHVTLELQNLAGMPGGFGKARETGVRGVYKVVGAVRGRRRSPAPVWTRRGTW